MSDYEGLRGNGVAKQADLRELRKQLAEAHNRQIAGLKPQELKKLKLAKATARTKTFLFLTDDPADPMERGSVVINVTEGTFEFSISENNHAVASCEQDSLVYKQLQRFLIRMDTTTKGKKYGAETYHWSENHSNDNDVPARGMYTRYGGRKDTDKTLKPARLAALQGKHRQNKLVY